MRTRLENGLSGFILTKNISDKPVNAPEERVHVSSTRLLSSLWLGGARGGDGGY